MVDISHYLSIFFRKRTRIQHIMTEGNRKTQLTTESRRADAEMERRSITEAGSAPTSTSAGSKKAVPKTRATNRSGRRTRPGAEKKTERDATKGTKTGKKTEAKSARRRESGAKMKRGTSLGSIVPLRFVRWLMWVNITTISLFRCILPLNYTSIKPAEAVLQLGIRKRCLCTYTVCVCVCV